MLPLILPTRLTKITIDAGSEGSGKSTAVKQMKIAYDGFSVEERIDYRAAIYRNLLESAQALVFTMEELSIKPVDLRTRVRHTSVHLHTLTDKSGNATGNRRTHCII